ncbi:hypothetical protein ABEB36_010751 [Hypothenemus hampei]|uniref:Uncharacterized protein n=1 Tax=Hypothenemus hampei TaxID=57062 RepID=A0ABD1ECW8_HYPHA
MRIAIVCNGERKEVTLNNTGIISISQNCIISTKKTILTPKKSDAATIMASYVKRVAANLTVSGTRSKPISAPEFIMKPFEDLNSVIKDEQKLQDELDEIPWKTITHHSMMTSVITTTGIVMLIIVLLHGSRLTVEYIQARQAKNRSRKQPPINQTEGIELEPLRSFRLQDEGPAYAKVNIRPDHSCRQNVQVE